MINKIVAIQQSRLRRATPPPPPETAWYTHTPRMAREIVLSGRVIRQFIESRDIDDYTKRQLRRFIKGSISNGDSRTLSERDLAAVHKEAVSKAARKRLDGRVAQSGGVITVRDVRAKATKRKEDELEKAEKLYERLKAAEDKRLLVAEKKLWKGLFAEANHT